jgi:peptidyl-prolyl cis-trans isomerase SurA
MYRRPLMEPSMFQLEPYRPAYWQFLVFVIITGSFSVLLTACRRVPSSDAVAAVNGHEILRAELERQYQVYRNNLKDSSPEISPEQSNITRLAILRQMLDSEILQQQAAKLNLVMSEDDISARLTEIKAQYTQEEFDKWLKQRHQTPDDLKRDLRKTLTQNKLFNKQIESRINITDSEINRYYSAHWADFNLTEPKFHLARIVISGEPDSKKKIQELQKELEDGEEFATVATRFSTDADSALNGGDMGFVRESQFPDALREITELKAGQVSGILPFLGGGGLSRPTGYAIYEMIARESAGQHQLNDPNVQQLTRQTLRERRSQLLRDAYIEFLRDEATVHNHLAEQIYRSGAL